MIVEYMPGRACGGLWKRLRIAWVNFRTRNASDGAWVAAMYKAGLL